MIRASSGWQGEAGCAGGFIQRTADAGAAAATVAFGAHDRGERGRNRKDRLTDFGQVLEDLGYSAERIAGLRGNGIV